MIVALASLGCACPRPRAEREVIVRVVQHFPKLSDAPLAYDQSFEHREVQTLRVVEVVEGRFDHHAFNVLTYSGIGFVFADVPFSCELRWRPKHCMYEVVRCWRWAEDQDAEDANDDFMILPMSH